MRIKTNGGTSETVVRYNQLRSEDASAAKNAESVIAIQQIEIHHRVGDAMKAQLSEGFDEG